MIPVNPEVLKWARASSGKSVAEVAAVLGKSPEEIEAWERGDSAPTYVQLELLAYGVYKRPIALFFFPEPPDEVPVEQSFRTLPEYKRDDLPAHVRFLLRKARALQINLSELFGGINPSTAHILRDLQFDPSVSSKRMAAEVRDYLGVALEHQQQWRDEDEAFANWRSILEDHGVFIFKDSFRSPGRRAGYGQGSPFSGFCLYDSEFPLIYVNNGEPSTRQIFTLFHELAHLLMRTGGVDSREDDYVDSLTGDARRIEVLCNQFAAAFLVPDNSLKAHLTLPIDDDKISRLARLYCVSREVILRRLLDLQLVTREYYERKATDWAAQSNRKRNAGGDHYRTRGAYLGERYIGQVLSLYYQQRITLEQAADYLGERPKNVPGFERWFLERRRRE